MAQSRAEVATDKGGRYLTQLCKHWAHRFTVRFDETSGEVDFGEGSSVRLRASEALLIVEIETADNDGLSRLEGVVADHLNRFAFREPLSFDWRRQTDGGRL